MRNLDFSSWQALLSTLLGLALITLIGVGVRLVMMQTLQQRRERENRQINERLRTLIAAYKTLGGSFSGNLAVDPTHLRDLKQRTEADDAETPAEGSDDAGTGSDRARRIRDAVEAALSDVILLGTEQQVRLAAAAAADLAAGRPVHMHELVVSLRDFIRQVLDLGPMPAGLAIPAQGPTRPSSSGGKTAARSKGEAGEKASGGKAGSMGGMAAGAGMGIGVGGLGGLTANDEHPQR